LVKNSLIDWPEVICWPMKVNDEVLVQLVDTLHDGLVGAKHDDNSYTDVLHRNQVNLCLEEVKMSFPKSKQETRLLTIMVISVINLDISCTWKVMRFLGCRWMLSLIHNGWLRHPQRLQAFVI
jgi:hypothetical protein